ncbi:MAG TPA: hypothetical protein VGL58_00355 [Caulobacteraceae bacterium]|jgi:hypothetical protein
MVKKTATLVGAAALVAGPALAAAPPPSEPAVPVASSYAELLAPVPNAVARLRLADAAQETTPAPQLIQAQYHHHHHHHHSHYTRSWYMSHGYSWFGGRWVLRPVHHHHHHHHN